jgi:hypothetical protein
MEPLANLEELLGECDYTHIKHTYQDENTYYFKAITFDIPVELYCRIIGNEVHVYEKVVGGDWLEYGVFEYEIQGRNGR